MLTLQQLQSATASGTALVATATVVALSIVLLQWTMCKEPALPEARDGVAVKEPHTLRTCKSIIGDTFDLLKHMDVMHDWMVGLGRELQGEAYYLSLLGRPKLVVLYTPQQFEDVYKNEFDAFPKGPYMTQNVRDVLGHGIFAVDGIEWLHQRKVASHMFTMRTMRDSMARVIRSHLERLGSVLKQAEDTQTPIDLYRLFNRFTMDAFTEIGFGVKMNLLETEDEHPFQRALDRAQELIITRFVRPEWLWKLQRWLNVGAEAELKQVVNVLDRTILDVVSKILERRVARLPGTVPQTEEDGRPEFSDVVSLFVDNIDAIEDAELKAKIENNPVFFRDVAMNFLLAGRDTTAQTLSWLFVELDKAPRVPQRLRGELAKVLPSSDAPSMSDLQQLVYLEAAIKETLRLHPPVPVNPKHVDRDVVLSDGTYLRKGTTVSLAVWAMGRMPFVWGDDAEEFKPERWIDRATGKLISVSQYKFASFNAGPRLCLGMNLAMMEMKMVVAAVLQQFDVKLVPGQTITYVNSVSLPIKGKLMATIKSALSR